MNEFEARDYIFEKGKDIKTIEELASLIEEVKTNFNYDYGVAPRTIGAVAVVVANYLSCAMGITGYQASLAMWDFISGYIHTSNKCGMRLLDYDDMLYPQYYYKYAKTISTRVWKALQKEAKEKIKENKDAHPDVIEHWQSIVKGIVPFGYVVKE